MICLLIFSVFLICSFWFFGSSDFDENGVDNLKKVKKVHKKRSSVPNIWEILTHGYKLLFCMNNDGEIVTFNLLKCFSA